MSSPVRHPVPDPGLGRLRRWAVAASLFAPTSLASAVRTLGFVQYDPIRRPARAQDLILHQRVRDYRVDDLARRYAELGLEEDHLHAYGALPRPVAGLLRPRPDRERPGQEYTPEGLAADVLAVVREHGPVHPKDLAARFGRVRAVNDWGGFSAATTRALERLHYHGFVRVVRRDNGIKVYESCPQPPQPPQPLSPEQRLRRLTLHLARLLAPIPEPSLRSTVGQLHHASGGLGGGRAVVADLLRSGELDGRVVDGVRYLWPAEGWAAEPAEVPDQVRFLAPFDPVVWDRRRFEHLWGWAYRFEAYTPVAKRRFGYYALPMFLADQAIGWVNCEITTGARPATRVLSVDVRFVDRPPRGAAFRGALDREVARLEAMLALAP